MPRLAPDSCSSLRYELGNYERSLAVKYLAEQKRANTLNSITNITTATIYSAGGITGAFIVGMLLAPNIIDEVVDKIKVLKEVVDNQVNNASGKNKPAEDGQDGGFATILCVGYKDERQWTGEPSPNQGKVVVAPASGWPIIGGLSGAALYVLSYGQDTEEWVGIWGNQNKKATKIEELSQPWWYLDPKTGGPLY